MLTLQDPISFPTGISAGASSFPGGLQGRVPVSATSTSNMGSGQPSWMPDQCVLREGGALPSDQPTQPQVRARGVSSLGSGACEVKPGGRQQGAAGLAASFTDAIASHLPPPPAAVKRAVCGQIF